MEQYNSLLDQPESFSSVFTLVLYGAGILLVLLGRTDGGAPKWRCRPRPSLNSVGGAVGRGRGSYGGGGHSGTLEEPH